MATSVTASEDLHCMEVWGGNGSTDNHFARPGLDVWVWSQSEEESQKGGNDVHLLSSCASGRITRALIADICGPESVPRELGAEFKELLLRNVNAIRQSRVIREMSRRLRDFSSQGGYASVLVSSYFAPTRSLAICNAGHPSPFLYRATDATWSVLKQSPKLDEPRNDVPLGVLSEDEFHNFDTKLGEGDMVLCYSNSLAECLDGDGHTIGVSGLLERLRSFSAEDPSEVVRNLPRRVEAEHVTNLVDHDATVLLYKASKRRVGWKNNLLAPLRLLRRVSDNTHLA